MSNPVVTAVIYDPEITDPAVTNIIAITQGRFNNLIARRQPFVVVEQGRFDLQATHRVNFSGEPGAETGDVLVPLTA